MKKINWKKIFIIGCWLLVIGLLIYTRFVNLGWGLPYPMHPDERNMAWALMNLSPKNWFKPDFFAYGQFPLYLGYLIIMVYKGLFGRLGEIIGFDEAVISLRMISATASVINAFILVKIVFLISKSRSRGQKFLILIYHFAFCILIFAFAPYFIQFSHFGTTESLLMLLYSLIVYQSLQVVDSLDEKQIKRLALFSGLAIATKASSAIFLAVPITAIFFYYSGSFINIVIVGARFILLSLIFSIIFSPYNFISLNEFLGSMRYESDVAFGRYLAFYIRQFILTPPIIFQATKIFPYVLGWPIFILGLLGMLGLSFKDKRINLLRFAFLIYFLPTAFLFAKWTRFMTPILPLMTVFAVLFILRIKIIKVVKIIVVAIIILPGISYLSVYQNPDVRFTASDWIYKNIPNESYILSETANVVDIPLELSNYKVRKVYKVISFNFYDLDKNFDLQDELKKHLAYADYIFVPSRRIFKNHICINNSKVKSQNSKVTKCNYLEKTYPFLSDYYHNLFLGRLGFIKVAEFNSYPKISIFGKTLIEFPDEEAEETWSVFDHPVIRIYKRR